VSGVTRRGFLRLLGAGSSAAALALGALGRSRPVAAKTSGRVIVVGGGFGGATCASYLRRFDPSIEVTLIEPSARFVTCPFSNTVLGGLNSLDSITHSYDVLREKRGVQVVHDVVTAADPSGKSVTLKSGKTLSCDRLVLAPGIALNWNAIEGYDEKAAQAMPHAWQAGEQTLLLRKQIEAMRDGGVVIIAVPSPPYRCPPAPYERASLIAYYLKETKPKSKILILDANDDFPGRELFLEAWAQLYPGMIERVGAARVARVDPKAMTAHIASGQTFRGDVVNVIPPQQAGEVAHRAGLTGSDGWCRVSPRSFEGSRFPGVHVIGDACAAAPMPKTGFAATAQAKVVAAAIVAGLRGEKPPEPIITSSLYSLISPKYAISEVAVYRIEGDQLRQVAGGASPKEASKQFRLKEANYAVSWYKAITSDAFAA
jgi:sulfide dehydrogenase [flavocytochrome c] flavoprotein subunit